MIEIEQSQHWHQNRESTGKNTTADPCIVCGKHVRKPKHHIRLFWGFTAVTEAEAKYIIETEGEGGDMYYYPVGSDCLRKHPELKPYVADAKRTMSEVDDLQNVSYVPEDQR